MGEKKNTAAPLPSSFSALFIYSVLRREMARPAALLDLYGALTRSEPTARTAEVTPPCQGSHTLCKTWFGLFFSWYLHK